MSQEREGLRERWRRAKRRAASLLWRGVPRCASLFPLRHPLRTVAFRSSAAGRRLLVLLPGIGDLAEEFSRAGFVDAVRQTAPGTEMVAVDAHLGYYTSRSLVERLHLDVIRPAIEAGYSEISLAGISLGGLGALLYAGAHPQQLSRVWLLAPYLGPSGLVREIREAGGLARWAPEGGKGDAPLREVWGWIKERREASSPPLYLGYGAADRFAAAHRLLAETLPPEQVREVPGGHDWKTWRTLWSQFLPLVGPPGSAPSRG